MERFETKLAESLIRRYKDGDRSAWAPLRFFVEKRLLERVTKISGVDDPERTVLLNCTVLEIFDKLLTDGKLPLEQRSQFEAFCAYALRHVVVALASQADAITDATNVINAQFHRLQ